MQSKQFKFEVKSRLINARAGVMVTNHGLIETPVFMPVGTKASVKSLSPEDVVNTGAQILLGNTYHLYLRPGDELIARLGGLHQFMRWDKPILTDSGGYQVSSLGWFKKAEPSNHLSKIDDDGVTFQSHIDGTTHRFTPEKAIKIQHNLGSDILMAFDEATPDRGMEYAKVSMERTHRWLQRCQQEWLNLESNNALFGIIQGGNYEVLRRESAQFVTEQDLPGIALGGGSIGQNAEETEMNAAWIRDFFPKNKPVYFMGVGVKPSDAVAAVKSGADMFDCVAPTKLARTGLLYTGKLEGLDQADFKRVKYVSSDVNERITIEKKEYEEDRGPINQDCGCDTCAHGYTRAYLHHLFRNRELLYYRLASIHNVYTMVLAVKNLRKYILKYGQ